MISTVQDSSQSKMNFAHDIKIMLVKFYKSSGYHRLAEVITRGDNSAMFLMDVGTRELRGSSRP